MVSPHSERCWRSFIAAANLRRRLAIEENAMPDLEIKQTPDSIAMISRTLALLCKDSLYAMPLEESTIQAACRK